MIIICNALKFVRFALPRRTWSTAQVKRKYWLSVGYVLVLSPELFRITAKVVVLLPERVIILEALFNAWLISNFQVTFQPRYRGYIKAHCGSGERVRGK